MSPIDQLNPMQQYLVHEFVEDYEDGLLSRRDMMSRVLHITGSVAGAATVLTALGVKAAGALGETPASPDGPQSPLSVPENDPRVLATTVTFPVADEANVLAYQASPPRTSGMSPGGLPSRATSPARATCPAARAAPVRSRICRKFPRSPHIATRPGTSPTSRSRSPITA